MTGGYAERGGVTIEHLDCLRSVVEHGQPGGLHPETLPEGAQQGTNQFDRNLKELSGGMPKHPGGHGK